MRKAGAGRSSQPADSEDLVSHLVTVSMGVRRGRDVDVGGIELVGGVVGTGQGGVGFSVEAGAGLRRRVMAT